MRRHSGTVLVVIGCALLILWRFPPRWFTVDSEMHNEGLFQRLVEPTDVSFDGDKLRVAVAQLARRHQVEIDTSPVTLEFDDRLDTPVYLNFSDISLENALSLLVDQSRDLAWTVKAGKISIMPVKQLTDSARFHVGRLHVIPAAAAGGNGIDSETLSNVVQSVIDVDSWEDVGGTAAIKPIPNAIAVSHSTRTQSLLRSLLDALVHLERHPSQIEPVEVYAFSGRCERLQERLGDRVSVDFDDVPIADALGYLREHHGLPLFVDKLALEEEGVDFAYQTTTLRLDNAKFSSVLWALLRPVDFVAQQRGEVVYVTSRYRGEDHFVVKVYPVRDLEPVGCDNDTLIELIEMHAEPNDWDSVGGPASIVGCPQGLVIACRHQVHQKIERLLTEVRRRCDPIDWAIGDAQIPDLLNPVVSFDCPGAPLRVLLSQLQEKHGVNLVLDEAGLAESGIVDSLVVAGSIHEKPLFDALRQMLISYGMDVVVEDDLLLITSHEESEWSLTTQVYDCRSLIVKPFGAPSHAHDEDSLVDAIVSTIAPNRWEILGGEGSIGGLADLVVVTQAIPIHQSVERLVKALKQVPDERQETYVVDDIHRDPLHPIVIDGKSVGRTWTVAIYGLPRRMKDRQVAALSDTIRATVTDWAEDDGGDGELIIFKVTGRHTLIVRQLADAHRRIRGIVEEAADRGDDAK